MINKSNSTFIDRTKNIVMNIGKKINTFKSDPNGKMCCAFSALGIISLLAASTLIPGVGTVVHILLLMLFIGIVLALVADALNDERKKDREMQNLKIQNDTFSENMENSNEHHYESFAEMGSPTPTGLTVNVEKK